MFNKTELVVNPSALRAPPLGGEENFFPRGNQRGWLMRIISPLEV